MSKIERRLDFRPNNCGTCVHCRYDLDRRICNCAKSGEDIGKNQYCYTCDEWEKEPYNSKEDKPKAIQLTLNFEE